METILIIIAIAAIAGIAIWWFMSQQKKDKPRSAKDPFSSADDDSVRGNPRTIKPGDIVTVRERDYMVRGLIHLTEGSYTWTEALLDTGTGDRMWLSVEDDPELEVVIWREQKATTLTPGPRTVELDGRVYSSDESGSARFETEGTTGLSAEGTMRYHDYESDDDMRLSFEDFAGGKWECARGEVLSRAEFRIYSQADE